MSSGPVVVAIMSHHRSTQLTRLVERITVGNNSIAVIHHDPSGSPLHLPPSSDVAIIPDPIPCQWGRMSLVQAQWKTLTWVAANIPDFSWFLLISGQDYPVRSMASIEAELATSPHDGYLRHLLIADPDEDIDPWQALTRNRYLRMRRRPFSVRQIQLPYQRRHPYRDGTHLYVSEMWFNLSASAVRQILADRPLRDRLLRYLRWAPIPDETFIASMIGNQPGLDIAPTNRRYIKWQPGEPHPDLVSEAHLPDIRRSDAFFARKIDITCHPGIQDLLDGLGADTH
ncbi:beta-1,6-N-acetylglucosaminyltransferase [Nocardia sp. NPDC051756]|uniref:beta-1,6-N-acetylglucosaminyltransferase n=1 Tax=Nocardia sp. NPDC051756 TaxID=3154751 RepID=UPI003432E23C